MTAADDLRAEFDVLLAEEVVRRRTGLVFRAGRRDTLSAAIARGVQRTGAPGLGSYLARLEAEPALLDELVGEITVGETYFFRDPGQLGVIFDEVVPALLQDRPSGPLRIWSAGCATGEEAYTLAILFEQRGLLPRVSIVATDLSKAALALARRAHFGRWSLRGVSSDIVARYFTASGNRFRLTPELRGSVDFRHLNLAEDSYPSLATGISGMDLILCRNVLIYFDAETIARVARHLMDSLSPHGWLVTGASDPPLGDVVPCEVVLTAAGLAYRRPGRRGVRAPVVSRGQRLEATATTALPPPRAPGVREVPWERTTLWARPREHSTPAPDVEGAARAYEARDSAEAADAASQLEGPGTDAAAWVILVRSCANRGALDAAGRACAAGLDAHRTSAELAHLHGLLLLESGRLPEAAAALRRALYLDRGMAVTHLALAYAHVRMGHSGRAGQALRNAERLLARMPPSAPVPAADGELAGRLLDVARAQLSLLSGARA